MKKPVFAGLDVGSSCAKLVYTDPETGRLDFLLLNSPGNDPGSLYCLRDDLKDMGITHVGLTGSGAAAFAAYLKKKASKITVALPDGDPILRELAIQVAGIRSIRQEHRGIFSSGMVVSVGTGISYTRIEADSHTPFPIGNPMGGGFIVGVSGMDGSSIADIRATDRHTDLLMKERFPHLADSPVGEFVLASFGNANGADVETAAKCVATQIARDLMLIGMIPEWSLRGPVLFIGTPIENYEVLRYWISEYMTKLCIPFVIPEHAAYTGALGALRMVQQTVAGA